MQHQDHPARTDEHGTGRHSVFKLEQYWYVACRSTELRKKPLTRTVLDLPVVLFRDRDGEAAALVDRCPHRNVPLSLGRTTESGIQCAYHGWTFDRTGTCRDLPCLLAAPEGKGRHARALPIQEREGLIWIAPLREPGQDPLGEPHSLPHFSDSSFRSINLQVELEGTLHACLENILDVPHTAFLHGGLFRRSDVRNKISAHVTGDATSVQAKYVGEPRPEGLLGRLLAPQGGEVEHVDRFTLPSVASVDYAIGDDMSLSITNLLTPVSDFRTRMFSILRYRLPRLELPGTSLSIPLSPLVLPIFAALSAWVLRQDAAILREQTRSIQRFGGERFSSTEVDVLGADILSLLRQAEQGEDTNAPRQDRVVELET